MSDHTRGTGNVHGIETQRLRNERDAAIAKLAESYLAGLSDGRDGLPRELEDALTTGRRGQRWAIPVNHTAVLLILGDRTHAHPLPETWARLRAVHAQVTGECCDDTVTVRYTPLPEGVAAMVWSVGEDAVVVLDPDRAPRPVLVKLALRALNVQQGVLAGLGGLRHLQAAAHHHHHLGGVAAATATAAVSITVALAVHHTHVQPPGWGYHPGAALPSAAAGASAPPPAEVAHSHSTRPVASAEATPGRPGRPRTGSAAQPSPAASPASEPVGRPTVPVAKPGSSSVPTSTAAAPAPVPPLLDAPVEPLLAPLPVTAVLPLGLDETVLVVPALVPAVAAVTQPVLSTAPLGIVPGIPLGVVAPARPRPVPSTSPSPAAPATTSAPHPSPPAPTPEQTAGPDTDDTGVGTPSP